MARAEVRSLRAYIENASSERFLWDRAGRAQINELARGTSLGGRAAELAGRSVLLAAASQLTTALALIELDGLARRITILPPDAASNDLAAVLTAAEVDAVVIDRDSPEHEAFASRLRLVCTPSIAPMAELPAAQLRTEWVLLTSGTTGAPKLVVHSLAGLSAAFRDKKPDDSTVWGTFYDIRRYGGLQIFLRAALGGTSLVLSSAGEPIGAHLDRLAQHGVTHLLGTPTHWRQALMSQEIQKISPRYVRLSGEIADQAVLDNLRKTFPQATVSHAFASTEAGVAFEVSDGMAGFPASFLTACRDGVEMKVADGSLRIRSPRTASRYLSAEPAALLDRDGFVDTGDMVEPRGDRYVFVGRNGGVINVGGLKVHPEEVEAVINEHPQVRMSLVRSKRNPITGSVVIADVVLRPERGAANGELEIRNDILDRCRGALPRHKVPAAISFVPSLPVATTGKLSRRHG